MTNGLQILKTARLIAPACLFALAAGIFPVQAPAARVAVSCDKPGLVAGRNLWILRRQEYFRMRLMQVVSSETTFDDTGSCEVDVEPGPCQFSVLYLTNGTVVALQAAREITNDTEIVLASDPPRAVHMTDQGESLRIDKLSIRLENTTRAAEWERSGTVPQVILSPDQKYFVRAIGHREGAGLPTHVALWGRELPTADVPSLDAQTMGARRCAFSWGPSVRAQDAKLTIFFPEGNLDISPSKGFSLVTNRRAFDFEYEYGLAPDNRRIRIERRAFDMSSESHRMGGPFECSAWASYMYRLGQPDVRYIATIVELINADGDALRLRRDPGAEIDLKIKAVLRANRRTPKAKISTKEADAMGPPANWLDVEVSYRIDRPVRKTLRPLRFVQWKSEHFTVEGPPTWDWRLRSWMNRAERTRIVNARVCGRNMHDMYQITWMCGGGNALAGCGQPWQRMPIWSIVDDPPDIYAESALFVHENLHTYGYYHGPEMASLESMSHGVFQDFRVYHMDHPEYEFGAVVRQALPGAPAAAPAKLMGKRRNE